MHAHQFWWVGLFGFGDIAIFKNSQISILDMDYSPWSWKISIDRNRLKKFMQVGVDVTCMHTSFGGCDPFSFGDMATFQKRPNFRFGAWTIVRGVAGKTGLVGLIAR